jgi:Flp pilus assembly pilin Flp
VKLSAHPSDNKKGQALVEYALVLAFISILAIAVLSSMGQGISGVYSNITRQLANAGIDH